MGDIVTLPSGSLALEIVEVTSSPVGASATQPSGGIALPIQAWLPARSAALALRALIGTSAAGDDDLLHAHHRRTGFFCVAHTNSASQCRARRLTLICRRLMAPTSQWVDGEGLAPYLAHHSSGGHGFQPVPHRCAHSWPVRHAHPTCAPSHGSKVPLPRRRGSILRPAPAFLIGELRAAFAMGFALVLPFAVIDIIVVTALMSLGIFMCRPNIACPSSCCCSSWRMAWRSSSGRWRLHTDERCGSPFAAGVRRDAHAGVSAARLGGRRRRHRGRAADALPGPGSERGIPTQGHALGRPVVGRGASGVGQSW